MQLFTLQTVVELFSESEASILRLQWAPDSRRLALGSDGKPKFVRLASVDSESKLSVWNVQNGQLLTCCDLNSGVLQLQFCLLHLAFLTLVPAVIRSVSPEDPIHLNCLPRHCTLLWLAVSQCPDLTTGELGPTGPAVRCNATTVHCLLTLIRCHMIRQFTRRLSDSFCICTLQWHHAKYMLHHAFCLHALLSLLITTRLQE